MTARVPAVVEVIEAEFPLLNSEGCLTLESLCFIEELHPDQQAVVFRHVRGCPVCAQQQAQVARTAGRMRRARPRVGLPANTRVAAKQAILRMLLTRRRAPKLVHPVVDERATWRRGLVVGVVLAMASLLIGAAIVVAIFR